MRKIALSLVLVAALGVAGRGLLLWKGKVVGKFLSSDGSREILIRRLDQTPHTAAGFMGFGETSYRMEFYFKNGPRMQSCITYAEDSLSPGLPIKVEWMSTSRATVEIGSVRFSLHEGEWSRDDKSFSP